MKGRTRTPTVLQMEAVECGAASLAMVLAFHGRWVPLEKLRIECGVSRDGSSAAKVLRAARSHGLTATGYRAEPETMADYPFPQIIFWKFNHFLVVEGFDKDGSVRLNDPESGRLTVSADEFDRAYTGVTLTFEPGEDFERGGSPPQARRDLLDRISGTWPAVGLIILLTLLLVVPGLAIPGFLRVFVDRVLLGEGASLAGIVTLMVGVAVLLGALTLAQQQYLLRLETRLSVDASARFFRHILRLPVDFFSQRQPADIAARLGSNDTVAQILSRDVATAFVSAVVAVFYAVVLFTTDVVLALIGVATVGLNIVALRVVARIRKEASRKVQQDLGKITGTTYNGISLLETLKATGREAEFFQRWAGHYARAADSTQALSTPTQLLNAVPLFLGTVSAALILLIGSQRILSGALTIGLLIAFQTLMASFSRPIADLSAVGARTQAASADLARLADVERYEVAPEFAHENGGAPDGDFDGACLSGALELREVTFGYDPFGAPLIDGLSLRLGPGDRAAFVGGSGSGKSTVAKMISGLNTPWSGEVLYDGRPRTEIPRQTLGASLAVVDQEIFLFEGTVRENLTLWDELIPEEVLVEALKDAAIYEEVMSRPDGLDATLSEGGRDLSGGQRQRLEIARALAQNPTLLILDEATSALDTATEAHIDQSLRRRGCACVIVAHRLSTIRDADEILVFEAGSVVERGPHEELVDAGGPYATLVGSA